VVPTSIATVFDDALRRDPDHEAIVGRSGRLSYTELDRRANQSARALASLGARPGDRVAVSLPNDVEIVTAFHGAMRLGAIWVGINRALAPPEVDYILHDTGASLAITSEESASVLRNGVGLGEWSSLVDAQESSAIGNVVDPFAPAAIAYTSGTTGRPKGVVHSQHNLLVPGAATVASRGYGPELRRGDCLPLTILNLLALSTLLVAQAGGTCVIMDCIDADGVAAWIRDERVTVWNGVPAVLYDMVHGSSVTAADLASLDDLWTGGADCPESLQTAFAAKFGVPLRTTYGLTEAPSLVAIDPRGGPHVDGASGVPLPHLTLEVLDDAGAVLPRGEQGEICIRATDAGPWAGVYRPLLGHWRDGALVEGPRDGRLRTGDLGWTDDAGYLHITDRKSLLIIRGGANVYPAEVERVLVALPGVGACAVVGVPDERLGQRVAAVVQRAAGDAPIDEATILAHCRTNLARYKVPERIVFVDAFTRNAMGKIDRTTLLDVLEESPA
jgi:acyl-CoA synthetase (AMP-forming)/AMP-acid ligase II